MIKPVIFTITTTLAVAMLSNNAFSKTRHLFCGPLQCDIKGKSVSADPKNGRCCVKTMIRGKKIGGQKVKLYCKNKHKYYVVKSHDVIHNTATLTCIESDRKVTPDKAKPHTYQELNCWYAKKKAHVIFSWRCKPTLY